MPKELNSSSSSIFQEIFSGALCIVVEIGLLALGSKKSMGLYQIIFVSISLFLGTGENIIFFTGQINISYND